MNNQTRFEVVYWRYHTAYVEPFGSLEEALGFIKYGEDWSTMSSQGVFRDGEPFIWDGYVRQNPPTAGQAAEMRDSYAEAHQTQESDSERETRAYGPTQPWWAKGTNYSPNE